MFVLESYTHTTQTTTVQNIVPACLNHSTNSWEKTGIGWYKVPKLEAGGAESFRETWGIVVLGYEPSCVKTHDNKDQYRVGCTGSMGEFTYGGGGGKHLRSFIIPCCQIHHSLYSLHRSVEEGVLKMRQHGGHPVHSRREQDPQRDHRRAAAAQPLLRLRLRLVLVGRGVGG